MHAPTRMPWCKSFLQILSDLESSVLGDVAAAELRPSSSELKNNPKPFLNLPPINIQAYNLQLASQTYNT